MQCFLEGEGPIPLLLGVDLPTRDLLLVLSLLHPAMPLELLQLTLPSPSYTARLSRPSVNLVYSLGQPMPLCDELTLYVTKMQHTRRTRKRANLKIPRVLVLMLNMHGDTVHAWFPELMGRPDSSRFELLLLRRVKVSLVHFTRERKQALMGLEGYPGSEITK